MEMIKKTVDTAKKNMIGTIAGGAAGYFLAPKIGITKTWQRILIGLAGVIVGSKIQSAMKKPEVKSSASGSGTYVRRGKPCPKGQSVVAEYPSSGVNLCQ